MASPTRDELRALADALVADARAVDDPVEGLADLARLNVSDETRTLVQAVREQLLNRASLLHVTADAIRAVLANGYPTPITNDATDAVRADIATQQRTIAAAAALVARPPAARLNLTAGQPELK